MSVQLIKRFVLVSILGLFAAAAVAGCNVETNDVPEEEAAELDTQAINCWALCVRIYRACLQFDEPEVCIADRNDCTAACDEQTCEPSDPGCCQGQPTCW